MKHRRLTISLSLISLAVSLLGMTMHVLHHRTPSYAYFLNVPAGREGDRPRVFLQMNPLAGEGLWVGAVQVVWNGRPFSSPPGLSLPLGSLQDPTLTNFGINLPPFQVGTSKIEVTGISVFSHDGRLLKFPGRLSAETRVVPSDTDLLLELEAASRAFQGVSHSDTSCFNLVESEEPWTDAQWAEATTMLRNHSRTIEATQQAGRLHPFRSVLEWSSTLLKIETLGCLSMLLGRAEEYSGEIEAAIHTYLETMHLGLGVALSSGTIWGALAGGTILGQSAHAIGRVVSGGSISAELQSRIEREARDASTRWIEGVASVTDLKGREALGYSRDQVYYSPLGPVVWEIANVYAARKNAEYGKDLRPNLGKIRIVEASASSCRYYRENGNLPGRGEWPEGISIEPISGAEWIVAESNPTVSRNPSTVCWRGSLPCPGRLGLKVRCGSG